MTDEQWERWMRQIDEESPKEWEANPITMAPANMYGCPKREEK